MHSRIWSKLRGLSRKKRDLMVVGILLFAFFVPTVPWTVTGGLAPVPGGAKGAFILASISFVLTGI